MRIKSLNHDLQEDAEQQDEKAAVVPDNQQDVDQSVGDITMYSSVCISLFLL